MNNTKSMVDVAFDVISALPKDNTSGIKFSDLYKEVALRKEMNEDEKMDNIGQFYTDLSLDGRFVGLTDNFWDLRSKHTYEAVHIDIADVYSDVATIDLDDSIEVEEEKEYNAALDGTASEDEEGSSDEDGEGKGEDVSELVGM